MSRRLRSRAAAIEAKRAFAWSTPVMHDCGPEDDTDDEGGIDFCGSWSCPGCSKARSEPFHCTPCNADAEGPGYDD